MASLGVWEYFNGQSLGNRVRREDNPYLTLARRRRIGEEVEDVRELGGAVKRMTMKKKGN